MNIAKFIDHTNIKKEATKEDIKKIAQRKLVDLNTDDLEKAMKVVEGTAKQMGLEIVE